MAGGWWRLERAHLVRLQSRRFVRLEFRDDCDDIWMYFFELDRSCSVNNEPQKLTRIEGQMVVRIKDYSYLGKLGDYGVGLRLKYSEPDNKCFCLVDLLVAQRSQQGLITVSLIALRQIEIDCLKNVFLSDQSHSLVSVTGALDLYTFSLK